MKNVNHAKRAATRHRGIATSLASLLLFAGNLWAGTMRSEFFTNREMPYTDSMYTSVFAWPDTGSFAYSHPSRLSLRNGRLTLIGNGDASVYPYADLKPASARSFLRMKAARVVGHNHEGIRFCLSRDGGATWYWYHPDSSAQWIPSDGNYARAVSADVLEENVWRFFKVDQHDEFAYRIIYKYPYGYEVEDVKVWEDLGSMKVGRCYHSMATCNGKIYAFGGIHTYPQAATGGDVVVEEYNPATGRWILKTLIPAKIVGVNGTVQAQTLGDSIYVFGLHEYDDPDSTMWVSVYTPSSNTWSRKANMPEFRGHYATATVNGKMYIVGGGISAARYNSILEYNPAVDSFRVVYEMNEPVYRHTVAVANGKLYVFGWGSNITVNEFDPVAKTMVTISELPVNFLDGLSATDLRSATVNGMIYLFAPVIGKTNAEARLIYESPVATWAFNPVSRGWTRKTDMPYFSAKGACAVLDSNIYTAGGGHYLNGFAPAEYTNITQVYHPWRDTLPNRQVYLDRLDWVYDNNRTVADVVIDTLVDSAMNAVIIRAYPQGYISDCDTCRTQVCSKPIEVTAGDTVELYAHAFNDSGEHIGPVPFPDSDEPYYGQDPDSSGTPNTASQAANQQTFSPTQTADELVPVGPWYYRLIVRPDAMVNINIYVVLEGNWVELRNYRSQPGDTLILAAMGEDRFGNPTGELPVEWYASGDTAGAFPDGAFGSRTTVVAGPDLGQLGVRYSESTIVTADSVSMETVCLSFPIDSVVVRDSPGGRGNEVKDLIMKAGDTVSLYVAAYDSNGQFLTDLAVWWDGEGVVKDHIEFGLNNALAIMPQQRGTGHLTMHYSTESVGRITVLVEVEVLVSTRYRLEIRTGPGGTGELIDSLEDDVVAGISQKMDLYAAVVDAEGNHICDTVVTWTATAIAGTSLWSQSGRSIRLATDSLGQYRISASLPGFETARSDTISVVKEVAYLQIRTEPQGRGKIYSGKQDSLTIDESLLFYAAGYATDNSYIADISVEWSCSDAAQRINDRMTSSFLFMPRLPGKGRVTATLDKTTGSSVIDSTGTLTITAGRPSELVIQQSPVGIGQGTSFQFTALVKDKRGNIRDSTGIIWGLLGMTGHIDSTGLYAAKVEGTGRIRAAFGALADTTPAFLVKDGICLTDFGGTFTFPESVSLTVPAQSGLEGEWLDVDSAASAVAIDSFLPVGPVYRLGDCTRFHFQSPVTLRFVYRATSLVTLSYFGKTLADARLYGYSRARGSWEMVYESANDTVSRCITATVMDLHYEYVLGVDLLEPKVAILVPDTVPAGSALLITGTSSDNLPNNKVIVTYLKGRDTVPTRDTLLLDSQTDTFTTNVPGSSVTERGLVLDVQIYDGHCTTFYRRGRDGRTDVSPRVKVTNMFSSLVIPETSWVVFSLPCNPKQRNPLDFFGAYGKYQLNWAVASIERNSIIPYDLESGFDMEVNRVYWFATSTPGSVLHIPEGYTEPIGDTISFSAPAGQWAGCGNPYLYPICVRDIRKATGRDSLNIRPFMTTDGQSWSVLTNTDSLVPWKGYYVYNGGNESAKVKFPVTSPGSLGNAKALPSTKKEWWVGVRAEFGADGNDELLLGYVNGKSGQIYSAPMPPVTPNHKRRPQMSFLRDQEEYFCDARDSEQEGDVWHLKIQNVGVARSVSLAFRSRSQAKPEMIAVIDPMRNLYFDVTQSMQYAFAADPANERELKIAAGSAAYAKSQVAGIRAVPKSFAIAQNYPNPFNPITMIRFQVPALQGNPDLPGAEWASLRVYDLRGREVTTLFHAPVQAGYYQVVWNGCDSRNRQCGSGTYIYRLRVGNKFNKSLRMLMIK